MARQAVWCGDPDNRLTCTELALVRADRLTGTERAMIAAIEHAALTGSAPGSKLAKTAEPQLFGHVGAAEGGKRSAMRLERAEWTLGERIRKGGMGSIYDVASAEYGAAVAKLVPKAPGAERELLFADLTGVRNVIPVIDRGETGDYWVIVMPRADKSLREHLEEADGQLGAAEAVNVLLDIAVALTDLAGRVVHRDLKPESVLLYDGHWCVADFGISRYAEAATAPDTKKHAKSAPYATPSSGAANERGHQPMSMRSV